MQPVSGGYLLCSDSLESSAVSSVGSSQPSLGPAPPLLAALYTGTAGIMPCAPACASHYSTLTTSHVTLRTCAMTERQLNFNREQKNLCKSIKVTRDLTEWEKNICKLEMWHQQGCSSATAQRTPQYDLGAQLQAPSS